MANFNRQTPGAGSSTLAGLTDVDIDTPTEGQGIYYNASTEKFENGDPPASGGAQNLVINVKDSPYSAAGNGTTNDRTAIQAALDAAFAQGGGIVYLPPGVYGVLGTGTASDGCLRVKDNVSLIGAGRGASTIKLLDSNSTDVTGIVRTPTGEPTRKAHFADFTIDGNMANNTQRIIGFYLGVKPSHRSKLSVASTTATATTYEDDGVTLRAHGLSSGTIYIHSEDPRTTGDFVITVTGANTFTFTVASGTPSDAIGYTWYYDNPYADIADEDIVVERVEIKQCQAYAFDPHERVNRLTIHACVAHSNGPDGDGYTLDHIHDSTVSDCYAYNNQRNGFNIVTGSQNVTIVNCHSHNNSQYGFASQRGSTTIPRNRGIKFIGNSASGNGQHGLRLQMGIDHTVQGNRFFSNSRNGVSMEGCLNTSVAGNLIRDNGQGSTNTYDEIVVKQYTFSADSVVYPSQYNRIENNILTASLTVKSRYLIREDNDTSDYNTWAFNKLGTAGATGSADITTGNPNTIYNTDADVGSGSGGGATEGRYISTMSTSNDAATNAALFVADCIAASAARLTHYIPPGEYSMGYTNGDTVEVALSNAGVNFVRLRGEGALTVIKQPPGSYQSFPDFTALGAVTDYTVTNIATATSGAELSTSSEVTAITISGGPVAIAKHEMVSVYSDDLLPTYESLDARNYLHLISETYNYNAGTGVLLLGRKLPRVPTTGYCKLRVYNNSNIIVDIDDIAFEADGDVYDTSFANAERPQYVFRIAGVRDAKVGRNVTINSAWAGGPAFNSTMGCRYEATIRRMLNGVTGQVVLGYGPAADGPNLGLEIVGAKTYGGRHTPTSTFGEMGAMTITGATVGATTTLNYSSTVGTPAIGDRVEISGIVGTLSALNGTKQTITARTGTSTGTITFAYNSTGLAYTSGGAANLYQPDLAYRNGECEAMTVSDCTVNFGTGSCFDSHANSINMRVKNSTARWIYTLTPGSVAPTLFSSRGANECLDGIYGERITRFANIISHSLNYGMDNITTLNNCHLHDQQDRGAQGSIAYIQGYGASTATDYRLIDCRKMKVTGGAYRIATIPAFGPDISFDDFTFNGDWGIAPTAAQYMFDYAVAAGRFTMRNSVFDLTQVSTNLDVRILSLTGAGAVAEFHNTLFKGFSMTTGYPFQVTGANAKLRFIDCTFELDENATDNTILMARNNNAAGVTIDYINCRFLNAAKIKSTTGLIYSSGGSPTTTALVQNAISDAALTIIGSSSTAGSVTLDEVVPAHNNKLSAQTAAFTLTLPANHRIDSITINNATSNAITGGLKIGTTLGGVDVVATQAVGASAKTFVLDADLLKRFFSTSAPQVLYFDAVTAWNSASIAVTLKHSQI